MNDTVKKFIDHHYRHFNAAVIKDAANSWIDQINQGNKIFFTMAGAMSTAELGISLAEMIRNDLIHGISTTGANLEEDIFNLVAHDLYERIPNYRDLTAAEETALRKRGLNRVTDTCIPEEEAMRHIDRILIDLWEKAESENKRYFPYEYIYQIVRSEKLKDQYQIDPKNSWVIAASEKNLPIFTPGWEDSTTGNSLASEIMRGRIKDPQIVKSGIEQMVELANWYQKNTQNSKIGFFQIGGGIAGDFPICVVPMLNIDLAETPVPLWSYFCQISDSTTSYGSYSGAVPNEKITWGKLGEDTPKFIIESDASIVAPLIFQYILDSINE
jgi:deoxyhypusine synthase